METPGTLEVWLCDPFLRELVGSEQLDVDMLTHVLHGLAKYGVHRQLGR